MTFSAWLSNLCRNLTRRRQLERDVDDEVRSTFDLLVDEKLRAGQSRDRRAPRRGDCAGRCRAPQGTDPCRQGRSRRRRGRPRRQVCRAHAGEEPGLHRRGGGDARRSAIGANTTIFSFVHAFLLKPLPLEHLSRLVSVYMTDERNPGERGASRQNFNDFRDRNDVFDELTAEGWTYASLAGGESDPERVTAAVVAGNYFSTLGAKPIVGRGLRGGRGSDRRRETGRRSELLALADPLRRRPCHRRRHDLAQQPRVYRRRRDAGGVQGHRIDRRARAVGADHDLPGDHQRTNASRPRLPAVRLVQDDRPAEGGCHAGAGRSQSEDASRDSSSRRIPTTTAAAA